jgi:hypothetical protein
LIFHKIGHPCPPARPTGIAISLNTRRNDRERYWGLCCLGCVVGMMSLVLATFISRRTRMAPCCIGPENFRGAMIIDAPSMFPLFGKAIDARCKKKARATCRGFQGVETMKYI